MAFLIYDGSFEGFLTVIFECYSKRIIPTDICKEEAFQENLFVDKTRIITDNTKAERVWTALRKKLHPRNKSLPFITFLSGCKGIEMKLYHFARKMFDSDRSIETDFGDHDVLELKKIERVVLKESMRIEQFLRFQQIKDGLFFAAIEPEYDVLPISTEHFRNRFADQRWLVYDVRRDYGFYYDLHRVEEIVLSDKMFSVTDGKVSAQLLHEEEAVYQSFWHNYFEHVNIKERKNLKQQVQHMPRRYWKFLPEKNPLNGRMSG